MGGGGQQEKEKERSKEKEEKEKERKGRGKANTICVTPRPLHSYLKLSIFLHYTESSSDVETMPHFCSSQQ